MSAGVLGVARCECFTSYANEAFRRLQRFINIRFCRYLTHRSKGRGYGWERYPNRKLYAIGLIYIGSGVLERPRRTAQGLR